MNLKHFLTLGALMCFFFGNAQERANYYEQVKHDSIYFATLMKGVDEKTKVPGLKKFSRMVNFWESRVDNNSGYIGDYEGYFDHLESAIDFDQSTTGVNQNLSWIVKGPKELPTHNMGEIESIWVNPNDPNHILAGGFSGGLFKTTDGGVNWINITDNIKKPGLGVRDVAVDPNNHDIIFISTGLGFKFYGFGVYRTLDGGLSWECVIDTNTEEKKRIECRNILISPNNSKIIYVGVGREVYRSKDGGDTWKCILEKSTVEMDDHYWAQAESCVIDMELLPSDDDVLYVSTRGVKSRSKDLYHEHSAKLFKTTVASSDNITQDDWTEIRMPLKDSQNNSVAIYLQHIEIEPFVNENDSTIYIAYYSSDRTKGSEFYLDTLSVNQVYPEIIYTYQLSSDSYQYDDTLTAKYSLFELEVSPKNNKHIVLGGYNMTLLNLENDSLTAYGTGSTENKNWHVDQREFVLNEENGTVYLYAGNDGGICKYNVDLCGEPNNRAVSLNGKNLNNNHIFGIASSELRPELYLGGLQDNGILIGEDNGWKVDVVGDAYDIVHHSSLKNKAFVNTCGKFSSVDIYTFDPKGHETVEKGKELPSFGWQHTNRCMKYLPDGNFYTAYDELYKFNESINQFEKASNFQEEGILPGNNIKSFDASLDGNFILVGFGGATWDKTYQKEFKLYRSIDGGTSFEAVDDKLVQRKNFSSGLTNVVINPMNSNEAWLTFGNFSDKAILHTIDKGETWQCFESSAPNVPINKMKAYMINNKLELFITNDIGVYNYQNETNEWKRYGADLPYVWVNDIEMNYSKGELRIAAFGRGVNILDLPKESGFITIDSDQSWDTPQLITKDILVKKGATLTIKSKIYLKDSKIMVETGGNLIVDGGHLTKSGDNKWGGIEALGSPYAEQYPSSLQGNVQLKNHAIVEDAKVGVKNYRTYPYNPGVIYPSPYEQAGGIIKASSSKFIDCDKAVEMRYYSKKGKSSFYNCDFIYTEDYPITSSSRMVYLSGINGVSFKACNFINESGEFNGIGIYAYKSTVNIEASSAMTVNGMVYSRGEFTNLNYGVYANNSSLSRKLTIDRQDFACRKGLYVSNHIGSRITNNDFRVTEGLTGSADDAAYGVYLNACTQYHIENNNFDRLDSQVGAPLGLYILNSGAHYNSVYRNTFSNISHAIIAAGVNRKGNETGLCIKCNEFISCLNDIAVVEEEDVTSTENTGIAYNQGYIAASDTAAAGNRFSDPNTAVWNFNNEGKPLVYVMHKHDVNYNLDPKKRGPEGWSVSLNVSNETKFDPKKSCPSHLNSNGNVFPYITRMESAEQHRDLLKTEIETLTDGGNTAALNTRVLTATSGSTMEIKDELMSNSPYLSTEVLTTSSQREDIIPNSVIRDVLVKNPQGSKSKEVMESLNQREQAMPDYMLYQIEEGQNKLGDKEKLENQWSAKSNEREEAFLNIYAHYSFSDKPEDKQALIDLLKNEQDINRQLELIDVYLSHSEIEKAKAHYESIPERLEMNQKDAANYIAYGQLMDIQLYLSEQVKTVKELNDTQKQVLWDLVDEEIPSISQVAIAMLQEAGELKYHEEVILPKAGISKKESAQSTAPFSSTSQLELMQLHPNPAKDYIILDIHLEEEKEAIIEVRSMQGNLIQQIVADQSSQFTIDLRNYQIGTYLVQMRIGDQIVREKKFNCIK